MQVLRFQSDHLYRLIIARVQLPTLDYRHCSYMVRPSMHANIELHLIAVSIAVTKQLCMHRLYYIFPCSIGQLDVIGFAVIHMQWLQCTCKVSLSPLGIFTLVWILYSNYVYIVKRQGGDLYPCRPCHGYQVIEGVVLLQTPFYISPAELQLPTHK